MYWQQLDTRAQSIVLNYVELLAECIQATKPERDYYFEQAQDAIYFCAKVHFPSMNGVLSFDYKAEDIDRRCQLLVDRFSHTDLPVTWLWPHDIELPSEVEAIFQKHQFHSLGKYTSVAVARSECKNLLQPIASDIEIQQVENEKQFAEFLEITQEVYGVKEDTMANIARLYSAYRISEKISLFLAYVEGNPAATLMSYDKNNIVGLYNGATREIYRKKGLLTALARHAITRSRGEMIVAQLMAAQNAKGVCEQFGFKTYAHFTPLCRGFNVAEITA